MCDDDQILVFFFFVFFFFKQKTAYEIMPSLVGLGDVYKRQLVNLSHQVAGVTLAVGKYNLCLRICLLYTSDAADDLLCVDLGGRRIINQNNAFRLAQRLQDQLALTVAKCRGWRTGRRSIRPGPLDRRQRHLENGALRQNDGALNHVLELADVPWPFPSLCLLYTSDAADDLLCV